MPGCNLRGACGGKERLLRPLIDGGRLQSARSVWRQRGLTAWRGTHALCCNLRGACGGKESPGRGQQKRMGGCNLRGACGGKGRLVRHGVEVALLQSARSVWRQSVCWHGICRQRQVAICAERVEAKQYLINQFCRCEGCNLRGACGGKDLHRRWLRTAPRCVAICAERVEAKHVEQRVTVHVETLQSARSVWRQSVSSSDRTVIFLLQSARSVWRQRYRAEKCAG